MSYSDLTRKNYEVLRAIGKFIEEHGYPPSVRDVIKEVGITSTASGHRHLNELIELGYINHDEMIARSIRLTNKGKEALNYNEMEPSA